MFRQCVYVVLMCLYMLCEGYIEKPGSRYPPTKGEPWPKPQNQYLYTGILAVDPNQFQFKIVGNHSCTILTEALQRYGALLKRQLGRSTGPPRGDAKPLSSIDVQLSSPCEQWPSIDMNEDYYLYVGESNSHVASKSIWGILRGLETFSQLLYRDKQHQGRLLVRSTYIHDYPRFPHRGVLLDTSRHYVSIDRIYTLLDGLAYNKFNVFHWHIVDDQSFPYVSSTFPNISEFGAFHKDLIYTHDQIAEIVEYARLRGIRVLPEFDTPGHTRSWGEAYPKLLTECYSNGVPNGDLGPMNPAEPSVYTFMQKLLSEIVQVFPDKYFHIGGDEVDFDCWESNPEVNSFMTANHLSNYVRLEEYYIQKVVDMVDDLNTKSVVWQEVFLNGVNLQKGTMVQVWTGNSADILKRITSRGLPALLSTCWYLDHLNSGGDWVKFYDCEPLDFDGTPSEIELVKGGEACMWGEVIDDNNVIPRIFPRASATAEKLWSARDAKDSQLFNRLEEHYCRMNIRGVQAQPPSGPGFCEP